MRVNEDSKSMDMESRDINYILPAYVRLYLFQTRNIDPEKIIFPMFRSVPHPFKKGVQIPIEYIPDDSPIAIEIKNDGAIIPEATPVAEAVADKKEEKYNTMKKRIAELEAEVASASSQKYTPPDESNITVKVTAITDIDKSHQPTPERLARAKSPDKPAPLGSASDYGGKRDSSDLARIRRDIAPENVEVVDESNEKEDEGLVERVKGKKK